MADDLSKPPAKPTKLFLYLLGLPQDATREELATEYQDQIIPLIQRGPAHLFDKESTALMAGGLTGPQARRVFSQSKRGQKLKAAAERENNVRVRIAVGTPPF